MTAILKPPVSLFLLILLTICTVPLAASGVPPCDGDLPQMTPGEICYTSYSADGNPLDQQLAFGNSCVWMAKQQGQAFQQQCLQPDSVTLHTKPKTPGDIGSWVATVTPEWISGCKLLTHKNAEVTDYYIFAKSIKHTDRTYTFTCYLISVK